MKYKIPEFLITALLTIGILTLTKAQEKTKKAIKASIGYGISAPYNDTNNAQDYTGTGFYAQVEYVVNIKKWFALKPYAGLIFTSEDKNNKSNPLGYKVTSNAFLIGGKARVMAPIPYVAPYFELGLGVSAGSFETFTPNIAIKKNAILTHIPFSIGLAIGKKHNVDVEFTYYYQSPVQQFIGAMAIGLTFPINK